jgi:glycerol kinase
MRRVDRRFEPTLEPSERDRLVSGWRKAVDRSRGWVEPA